MIYNWLNDETSKILINMVKQRINIKEKLNYYIGLSNMKIISFTIKMKYARCIYNHNSHIRLTINKIYEVINIFQIGNQIISILIIDNKGDESSYFMNSDIVWFEDATVS